MRQTLFNLKRFNRFIITHKLMLLLLVLLSLLIFFPILHEHLFLSHFSLMEPFLSAILIISIYLSNSSNQRLLLIITLLAMLTVSVVWFNFFIHSHLLTISSLLLEIIYFSIMTIILINHVLSFKRVTADKIYGAISCYLLIGIILALIYTLIEIIDPNSFHFSEKLQSTFNRDISYPLYFIYFMYYSFVTISTLGYGDITPISHIARVFSSLEAIIGQLYVAILISRLVGLHINHTQHRY